ncbi:MAG: 4Fe-4S binding protein [candidate division WOR-3 bacterium]
MVLIDIEKCTGCGICECVCPMGVFSIADGKASANTRECIMCMNCKRSCPVGCISTGAKVGTLI